MIENLKQYLEAITRLQRSNHPEHADDSQHAFILRHGRAYPFGRTQINGTIKQCFQNAAKLAISDPDMTYCEGYTETHGVPIEHAWCLDKAGKVIETTIREREPREYFGVPIKTDYLRRVLLEKQTYQVFDWMHPNWVNTDPEQIVETSK